MKKIFLLSFVLALFVFTPFALAFQTEPPVPTLDSAWAIFLALAGWPAFLVAWVNLLKLIRIVPDGFAGTLTYWLNVAFFVLVAYLTYTGQLTFLTGLDELLGKAAVLIGNIIVILGGFTGSLAVNKFVYQQVRGQPLVGYSHSLAKAK